MFQMRKASIFILFLLLACSKDAPVPEEPAIVNYTVAVSASEGGSVNSPGGSYAQNSTITLTANAADGFVFSGWSGDVTGTTNPLSYSVTADASIVANFIRSNYSFNVQSSGQGSVAQELVSSAKSKTDYESGSTVRLTATPEAGWLFYRWEGLSRGFIDAATGQQEVSVDFDNPIDVEVNSSINATGTFEQIITEDDNPTSGVGKWKIRKKSVSSKSDKSLLVECDITEIIFRTDATFSIITSTATISGQYVFDSNTSVSLTQSNSPFGTITNIVISNSFISFSIDINNGCNDDLDGDKDEDYDEDTDTSLPPVISLVGSSTINLGVEDTFTDPGATASDNIDGDLTSSITSSGTVDTSTEGTYTIVYSVSDVAGNVASVSRTVIVSLDLPPNIILTGSATINIFVGETFTDSGATATDNEDGDLTASITSSGEVNTSTAGTYNIIYLVTDSAANTASVTREVIVNTSLDTTPPVITLTGAPTINLSVGDTFTDPGATATDNIDGNITSSIITSGTVNTSSGGAYTIVYSVSDVAGNTASIQRTVIVITVVSSYSISVTASSNADYTLSGTDANGAVSGDDVSITINAGDTLNFNVDAASHPFYIKTAQGTGTDNQASGVSNNGATNGTVTWTPTTAGTYYYQCSAHNGMYGTITVQ